MLTISHYNYPFSTDISMQIIRLGTLPTALIGIITTASSQNSLEKADTLSENSLETVDTSSENSLEKDDTSSGNSLEKVDTSSEISLEKVDVSYHPSLG